MSDRPNDGASENEDQLDPNQPNQPNDQKQPSENQRSDHRPRELPTYRRPALLAPSSMDRFDTERLDPAVIGEVAHATAGVIVDTGRGSDDPQVTERLVRLVDELGLSTLAQLWADQPARSLPGALWRLYVLREWVRRDPAGATADYRAGMAHADVAHVIAGAATPPGPTELRDVADAILRGVFDGDLAVALERAASFCAVVAAGRASRGENSGLVSEIYAAHDLARTSDKQARSAALVQTMSSDLAACARLWRKSDLV